MKHFRLNYSWGGKIFENETCCSFSTPNKLFHEKWHNNSWYSLLFFIFFRRISNDGNLREKESLVVFFRNSMSFIEAEKKLFSKLKGQIIWRLSGFHHLDEDCWLKQIEEIEDGEIEQRITSLRWFTNLEVRMYFIRFICIPSEGIYCDFYCLLFCDVGHLFFLKQFHLCVCWRI